MAEKKEKTTEGNTRCSISVRLIRHAESQNNQVYRDARRLFKGGTPEFDNDGWMQYVDEHRKADPGLSETGYIQADHLAKFLVPHLLNQASHPVRVITSPMKRTLETIIPTLKALQDDGDEDKSQIIVNAFYHESEGCHIRDRAEEGMNSTEIRSLLKDCGSNNITFDGFPVEDRGWYVNGEGAETRAEAETRATKFFVWLCEFLDHQLLEDSGDDVFDAGVTVPEEEGECEHDKISPRKRRRRTCALIGHGDFMGLVLKRIIAGFGHFIENEGVPHRSAFVHFNTGITELEYFGNGRFLLMNSNQTPHFHPHEHSSLRTGGGLKDGWSYIVPNDEFVLDAEVSVAFADELEDHVREQTVALKELYLKSTVSNLSESDGMTVSEMNERENNTNFALNSRADSGSEVSFVVKRGLQVVGCASYDEQTGHVKDVVVRPSARKSQVGKMLLNAIRTHERKLGRSGSLLVTSNSDESKKFYESLGFEEKDFDEEGDNEELKP